jgi:PIN domain nuclease of toxin-antitoxin system
MKYLLDTHAFLWYLNGDDLLSKKARIAIESPESECFISIVSFWEITIKISLGKLITKRTLGELKNGAEKSGFIIQQIRLDYFEELINLPFEHRDPFDRILVAICKTEDFQLISKDNTLSKYQIEVIW